MKYPIVYMSGNGLTQKNKIKTIQQNLPLIEAKINIEILEGNINDISNYDYNLLKPDYRERLQIVKDNLTDLNEKTNENRQIIERINEILKMKMNKIKDELVTEAETLQTKYLDNYGEISEKYEIYLSLSLEVEEIMRTHGSAISDAKEIAKDFGEDLDQSDLTRGRSDSTSSEESFDFM